MGGKIATECVVPFNGFSTVDRKIRQTQRMIHGHKPGGYFAKADWNGHLIEGETRQCCHCQYVWEYRPGSGDRRGWCLKHEGFLCARVECFRDQALLTNLYFMATGKVVSCLAFEEWNNFLAERQAQLKGEFHFTEAGLIVPGPSPAE